MWCVLNISTSMSVLIPSMLPCLLIQFWDNFIPSFPIKSSRPTNVTSLETLTLLLPVSIRFQQLLSYCCGHLLTFSSMQGFLSRLSLCIVTVSVNSFGHLSCCAQKALFPPLPLQFSCSIFCRETWDPEGGMHAKFRVKGSHLFSACWPVWGMSRLVVIYYKEKLLWWGWRWVFWLY